MIFGLGMSGRSGLVSAIHRMISTSIIENGAFQASYCIAGLGENDTFRFDTKCTMLQYESGER